MPPRNPILGRLLIFGENLKKHKIPPNIHMPHALAIFAEDFEHTDSLFYMDL